MAAAVLHPYAPDVRPDDQAHCWRALEAIRERWPVVDTPCVRPADYEDALIALWGARDIVVCEHDMEPSPEMIEGLLSCPHPLCARAYVIYPVSTKLGRPEYSHLVHGFSTRRWVAEGEEWADESGLGLTKIGLDLQRQIDPNALRAAHDYQSWHNLDSRLVLAVRRLGVRFHLHWPPCPHHHDAPNLAPFPEEPMVTKPPPEPRGSLCLRCSRRPDCPLVRAIRANGSTEPITACTHFDRKRRKETSHGSRSNDSR